jgi:hypothetical protein
LKSAAAITQAVPSVMNRSTGTTKKLDSKLLATFNDPNYEDIDEVEDSRGSGIKILPLMLKISKCCRKKDKSKSDSDMLLT